MFDIKRAVAAYEHELISLRRDFHCYPELGFTERRTSRIAEEYLTRHGWRVSRCAGTGLIALLSGAGPGKTVMLRSDLDALPVTEQTGLDFASQTPGVCHACGHDGHIAMLLVAGRVLAEHREEFSGTVKLVFQPNEEDAGAQIMIDQGALEDPSPQGVFGLHLWSPLPSGVAAIVPGPLMASSYYFTLTIHGEGGHGGQPHLARNPISAGCGVVQAAQDLAANGMDALLPTTITFGCFQAGTKNIVLPERAVLEGSIRCLHQQDEKVREMFTRRTEQVCAAWGCGAEVKYELGNRLLANDPDLAAAAASWAEAAVGKERVLRQGPGYMIGEDFAEFIQDRPGCFILLGVGGPGRNYPHHHPKFDIDERVLPLGAELHIRNALGFLAG